MDLEWQNLDQKDQKESLGQQKMWQLTLTCEDKKQEEDSTDLTKMVNLVRKDQTTFAGAKTIN